MIADLLMHIDPVSLPLWAVVLFSACMFPIGIILPCSRCCQCNKCEQGDMPETITVTLNGLPTDASHCCGYWNGQTYVLKRGVTDPCTFEHRPCGVGNKNFGRARLWHKYEGPGNLPIVVLESEVSGEVGDSRVCNTVFTGPSLVTNCNEYAFTATSSGGATAQVTRGGTYDPTHRWKGGRSCFVCCKGESAVPQEVAVTFTGTFERAAQTGDYVLSLDGGLYPSSTNAGLFLHFPSSVTNDMSWGIYLGDQDDGYKVLAIEVRLSPCGNQTETQFYGRFQKAGSVCENCHNVCSTMAVVHLVNTISDGSGTLLRNCTSNLRPADGWGAGWPAWQFPAVARSCGEICTQQSPVCAPAGTHQTYGVISGNGQFALVNAGTVSVNG